MMSTKLNQIRQGRFLLEYLQYAVGCLTLKIPEMAWSSCIMYYNNV